jgi:CheY-like chemotaxis protein
VLGKTLAAKLHPGLLMQSILLVEDSRFLRRVNERALTNAGYQVLTAADGEEALRLASSQPPDMILLDMMLPKLGGQQVLQALRQNPTTSPIPVVVLSSLPQANEERLMSDGAAGYVEKSRLAQDPQALVHVVRKTLSETTQNAIRKS